MIWKHPAALLLIGSVCALGCPTSGEDTETSDSAVPTDGSTSAGPATGETDETGETSSDTTSAPETGGSTTGETGETTDPSSTSGQSDEGLVAAVSPDPPRAGSIAQLSATYNGAPVDVSWSIKQGGSSLDIAPDGAATLPMTMGSWVVEASLDDDPDITDTVTVTADFRGGAPVSGWGNWSAGRWLYDETTDDDLASDLVGDADNVYAVMRSGKQYKAVVAGLDEATGDGQPGFGQNGLVTFTGPGNVSFDPFTLGLSADRVYVEGDIGLGKDGVAAASRENGFAVNSFGVFESTYSLLLPTPDLTGEGVFVAAFVNSDDLNIFRLLADGTPDMSWGNGGAIAVEIPEAWTQSWDPAIEKLAVRELAVDESGRLYVLLRSLDQDNSARVAALLRYTANGALDGGFGFEGATLWAIDNAAGTDPAAMQIAEDGAIYVVGSHYGRWFGTRIMSSGVPDASWGDESNVTFDYDRNVVSPVESSGVGVAAMPGGYVVFLVELDAYSYGALVRFRPDGVVDLEFGDADSNGDGWSVVKAEPEALAGGSDGRVFVMSQYTQITGQLVERDVWVSAVHSY